MPVRGPSLADFDDMFLLGREQCPACGSKYVLPARYVPNSSGKVKFMARCCLSCRSCWNPPGLIGASGGGDSSTNSLEHHLAVQERNMGLARNFFGQLSDTINFSSVLEIGCGIGTALRVAASMGKKVRGYDIDRQAIEKGRALFDIDLKDEEWKSDTLTEKYDLILCIQTLEHFIQPLPMVHELATYARAMRSIIFVSVPFFEKNVWEDLLCPHPHKSETNILRYAPEHATLFSRDALKNAFVKYGCKCYWFLRENTWKGLLCDFRESASGLPAWTAASPGYAATLQKELERLRWQEVYFWGMGDIYKRMKGHFAKARPRCILVDVKDAVLPDSVDNIPVKHPRDILPGGAILPIVIFAQDVNAVYATIRKKYPAYTDLVFVPY